MREGNTIQLNVNTVTTNDPAVSCLQVLTPFEQVVALDISALQPGKYAVNASGLEQSFEMPAGEAPAASLEQFRQVLANALNARDYTKLKTLMEPSFTIAYWGSEGSTGSQDQAIEQLQRSLLNASSPIVADPNKDFVALLRSDPITAGAVEASFDCANTGEEFCVTIAGPNSVKASPLFTSGWGAQGKDEAILFLARRANGELYWHGIFYAKDGFLKAEPTVAVQPVDTKAYATQVQYVRALEDVRMRSGPGTQFSIIGFIAAGQTGKVTGVNYNRSWWRVICPDGSFGSCWVSAASNLTRPADSPLPENIAYPTNVQYVMAQKDVNIYNGPSSQYSVVGFVAGGQTAKVTGVSADRNWWRVVCPVPVPGNCWVSADTSQNATGRAGREGRCAKCGSRRDSGPAHPGRCDRPWNAARCRLHHHRRRQPVAEWQHLHRRADHQGQSEHHVRPGDYALRIRDPAGCQQPGARSLYCRCQWCGRLVRSSRLLSVNDHLLGVPGIHDTNFPGISGAPFFEGNNEH